MRKEQFYITTDTGKKPVYGYITAKDGVCFGIRKIGNKINSVKTWLITELSTGLYIPYDYRTRKDALDGIDGLIKTIKVAIGYKPCETPDL